jgi:DNA helicase-2/ATP-dependent DNA helicase PcrA
VRESLANAAQPLLDLLQPKSRIAVVTVVIQTVGDLGDVFGYLIEPAFARCIDLVIHADSDFDTLMSQEFIDPDFGYGFTSARLAYRAERTRESIIRDGLPPLTPIEDGLLRGLTARGLEPRVQFGIGAYRADFAFPSARLVVEADGRGWHDPRRDDARDRSLRSLGWVTERFPGWRIHYELDLVLDEVEATLLERAGIVTYSELEPAPRRGRLARIRDWLVRIILHRKPPDLLATETAPVAPEDLPEWKRPLDREQRAAVEASAGVVQVIAPAGSGKTTTMVARVLELISRGVPQNRILCTTFNRATREELEDRLAAADAGTVDALSFHALGRRILADAGRLRSDLRTMTHGQWRRLARQAMGDSRDGIWIDPPAAADVVSDFKLAQMVTPAAALEHARLPAERTAAALYDLYEKELEAADFNDFDDLIIKALWLLRDDPALRERWTSRWHHVLVDEYQDIEPAQELLIRAIAAPDDNIFAVGDEDQCIYSWRRASVERIVLLDHSYPGLERHVLTNSYRCPAVIVEAATRLISRNRMRFPKTMVAANTSEVGAIAVVPAGGSALSSAVTDRLQLVDSPEKVVVLARTTRLLREVAVACVEVGIRINAPARTLRPSEPERSAVAYLEVATSPGMADADAIGQSFRVPNRYLAPGQGDRIVQSLRGGTSFLDAVASLGTREDWRVRAHAEWADLMERLRGMATARTFMEELRGPGGLDRHFSEAEQLTPYDQVDVEVLDDITDQALGSPMDLLEHLIERSRLLENAQDDEGIELNTIHGAKGREWDFVILYRFDADQLPHHRTISGASTASEIDEAVEDERRLAYVAITRTSRELAVIHTDGNGSPFLLEAGLATEGSISSVRPPPQARTTPRPAGRARSGAPTITAQHLGDCAACNRLISPGDLIRSWPDGGWAHSDDVDGG